MKTLACRSPTLSACVSMTTVTPQCSCKPQRRGSCLDRSLLSFLLCHYQSKGRLIGNKFRVKINRLKRFSLRELRCNLLYGVHKGLVRFLHLWVQLGKGLDRLVGGVAVGHPGGPSVVHVLRSNVFPDSQGEDRVHQEEQICVPFWQHLRWYLTTNLLRHVGDVVQASNAPPNTAT